MSVFLAIGSPSPATAPALVVSERPPSPSLSAPSPVASPVAGSSASLSLRQHTTAVARSSPLGDGQRSTPPPSPSIRPSSSHASFCSLLMMGGSSGVGSASARPMKKEGTDEDLLRAQVMWEIDRSEIEWGQERKLGTGTYGVVVYARWRGTPVAVKKVSIESGGGGVGGAAGGTVALTSASAIEDLRHEIAVMSHMHHPRVVQFLGACTRQMPWLILFEYLPGGTLTSIVDRPENAAGVRPALATRWSLECAQGLRYLHEHKPMPVIHRDLKPSNLLVDASGTAKISDFGLAKMLDIVKKMEDKYTMTGETGSYRYMAPEVFRHEVYNEKVDIYSLGCVMFFLFMGEPPLAALPPITAARAAAQVGKRAVLRPNVDRRIATLIEQCWSANPEHRPSAAQVCNVLEPLLLEMGDSNYYIRREGTPGCGCTLV